MIEIKVNNNRYLSELPEFSEGLPHGVFNKVMPDVGGTYLCINSPSDYIIVCPFIDLIESICRDKNNRYEVFPFYGEMEYEKWKEYADSHEVHKIAVTYDSFSKLTNWLNKDYYLNDYKVLIDEYHTILEDMDYREDAITNMISTVKKYNHYTFLSATPIDEDYEIGFLKALPHYRVKWEGYSPIKPIEIKMPRLVFGLVNFIREFLSSGIYLPDINGNKTKVKELYIFLNSVEIIRQVADELDVPSSDIKICCAVTHANRRKLSKKYKILLAADPSRKINFFTKKCFQGCNMFSHNGLIIVVSDAHKKHTLIDVSSTMQQIAGRLRYNKEYQNVFRHLLVHVYSTDKNIMDDDEFSHEIHNREVQGKLLLSLYSKGTREEKRAMVQKFFLSLNNDFISIVNGELVYNELKKKSFIYKHNLRKVYSRFIMSYSSLNENMAKEVKEIVAKTMSYDLEEENISYRMYKERYETWLKTNDERIVKKHPEFMDYKKYLKESEMNTLFWKKDKLVKLISDKQDIDKLFCFVINELKLKYSNGDFISSKELKSIFATGIKKLSMSISPKANLIEKCESCKVIRTVKRIKNKTVDGFKVERL